jgi:hypothetical protein
MEIKLSKEGKLVTVCVIVAFVNFDKNQRTLTERHIPSLPQRIIQNSEQAVTVIHN